MEKRFIGLFIDLAPSPRSVEALISPPVFALSEKGAAHRVTGGAGYIASHMLHVLVDAREHVVVLDNLSTGFDWAVPLARSSAIGDAGDQLSRSIGSTLSCISPPPSSCLNTLGRTIAIVEFNSRRTEPKSSIFSMGLDSLNHHFLCRRTKGDRPTTPYAPH